MKYVCGTEVRLNDEIMAEYGKDKSALARVVAIGTDLVVPDIDRRFYDWSKADGHIDENSVIVEWIGDNPFGDTNCGGRLISKYFTLSTLCCEKFVRRGKPI